MMNKKCTTRIDGAQNTFDDHAHGITNISSDDLSSFDDRRHETLHIVTTLFVMSSSDYNKMLNSQDKTKLAARQKEIDFCLRGNLLHPNVSTISILYNREKVLEYFEKLDLPEKRKLSFIPTIEEPTVRVIMKYVSENLLLKVVIFMHQDNILGEGIEHLDISSLLSSRITYALTRHVNTSNCAYALKSANCNHNAVYIGSHDAFIFSLQRVLPDESFDDLNFTQNSLGQENILIWWFENHLNYVVSNPCKSFHVYHHHCTPLHLRGRKRHNWKGKDGWIPFDQSV